MRSKHVKNKRCVSKKPIDLIDRNIIVGQQIFFIDLFIIKFNLRGNDIMGKTFQKPISLAEQDTHYCPGCTHGVIHRLVAEVIDELDVRSRTVGIAPVGCAVLAYNYFTFDFLEAAHGRAPAVATGIKRVRPDLIVFTYQGDGDLASIGYGQKLFMLLTEEKNLRLFLSTMRFTA